MNITDKYNLSVAFIIALSVSGISAIAGAAEQAKPAQMSPQAKTVEHDDAVFTADPKHANKPYNIKDQQQIYGGKFSIPTPRPLLELGRRIYESGPLQESGSFFGKKNPTQPAFAIYGDWRTAVAWNDTGAKSNGVLATRLNLDVDWKLTATERLHAFFRPLDDNGNFTRCKFSGTAPNRCNSEVNPRFEALFFEGDAGAISAGLSDQYQSYDLPFAIGKMPLLFQNGVWFEDAITGVAVTIPALNSPPLDISNMDITFFAAINDVSSAGVRQANGAVAENRANLYGVTAFIEANRGYWEFGYGYTDARGSLSDQSYHNISAAFTSRYFGRISNTVRVIHNFGQNRSSGLRQTADGTLLLLENSFVTTNPTVYVPYFNMFLGLDRPQSLVRDAGAGGVLKNTGINFETDGLTGFPALDATANNTYGGALGLEYLFGLDQQLVVEVATVQVRGNIADRAAAGDQYAFGVRYQRPLTKAWIFRADGMVANRRNANDLAGLRFEIRRKF